MRNFLNLRNRSRDNRELAEIHFTDMADPGYSRNEDLQSVQPGMARIPAVTEAVQPDDKIGWNCLTEIERSAFTPCGC